MLATDGAIQAKIMQGESLSLAAQPANPPAPVAGQARLYVKGGKLVIQWNKGGTVLYTTVKIDSAGPYPAVATVTTDTAAP